MSALMNSALTFYAPLLSKIDFSKARYFLLMRNGQPLLLIPPDRYTASLTLSMYLPQGRKAKLAVAGLKAANALGALQWALPRFEAEEGKHAAKDDRLPFPQSDIDDGCVGFLLCNPDHGGARIIAVRNSGRPSVIKWTETVGETKLAAEIASIKVLSECHLPGIPEIVMEGRTDTSAWFESPYYVNPAIKTVADPRVVRLLDSWTSEEAVNPLDNKLVSSLWATEGAFPCQNAVERLGKLRIRKAVVHGDFAPWNLRARQDDLVAIDWEWAEPDGLAGIDLCYGLLQEALLVKKRSPRQALNDVQIAAGSPCCGEYLKSTGWHEALDLWVKTGVLYRNSRKPCPELLGALSG